MQQELQHPTGYQSKPEAVVSHERMHSQNATHQRVVTVEAEVQTPEKMEPGRQKRRPRRRSMDHVELQLPDEQLQYLTV